MSFNQKLTILNRKTNEKSEEKIQSQVSITRRNLASKQAAVQTKVFTKWANSYLKTKGIQMDDITKEFSSGLNLCYMLSAMTGDTVKPPNSGKQVNYALAI